MGALFGRGRVVQELDDRLGASRLVTIIGRHGVGTTVLARAVPLRAAPMFTMGAGYVDLTRSEEAGVPALGPYCWRVDPRQLPPADELAPQSSSP